MSPPGLRIEQRAASLPANELGLDFSEWQALTDAYAEGVDALMRREPGAAGRLAHMAAQLRRYALLFGGDAGVS